MKLACFLSAEFIHMITAAFLLVILFLLVGIGIVIRRQVEEVVQRQSLSY